MSATLTFAERMQNAGIGTVIGIGTVFLILIFLWGLLTLMHKIFYRPEKPAEVKEAAPVQEVSSSAPQDDTQIIAVLTAAVAAVLDAQNIHTGFKIKSFRRTKS